jgi:hypothetical protein
LISTIMMHRETPSTVLLPPVRDGLRVSHTWVSATEDPPAEGVPQARGGTRKVVDGSFEEFRRQHVTRLPAGPPSSFSRRPSSRPAVGLALFIDAFDDATITAGAKQVRSFLDDSIFRREACREGPCRYVLPRETVEQFDRVWDRWTSEARGRLAPPPGSDGMTPVPLADPLAETADLWIESLSAAFLVVTYMDLDPAGDRSNSAAVLHIALGPDRITIRIAPKHARAMGHVWEPDRPIELRLGRLIDRFQRTADSIAAEVGRYENRIYDDIAAARETDVRGALHTSRHLVRRQRDLQQRAAAVARCLEVLDTKSRQPAFCPRTNDRLALTTIAARLQATRDELFTLQQIVVSSGAWEQADTLRRLQTDAQQQAERTGGLTKVVSALAAPSLIIGALSTSVVPWSHGSWLATLGMLLMAALCGVAAYQEADLWLRHRGHDPATRTKRRRARGLPTTHRSIALLAVVGVVVGGGLIMMGAAPGVETASTVTVIAPGPAATGG